MSSRTVAAYEVEIVADEDTSHDDDARMKANLPAVMESVEEDLTDRLPEGYRALVMNWGERRE